MAAASQILMVQVLIAQLAQKGADGNQEVHRVVSGYQMTGPGYGYGFAVGYDLLHLLHRLIGKDVTVASPNYQGLGR